MALRYHWGLGIGHAYSHHVVYDDINGLGTVVQLVDGMNMHLRSYSNRSCSTTQVENNSTSMDNVDNDEAAELMLTEHEALDWEESSDSETEKINGDCASEDERDYMDMYNKLDSDPEWMDMEG